MLGRRLGLFRVERILNHNNNKLEILFQRYICQRRFAFGYRCNLLGSFLNQRVQIVTCRCFLIFPCFWAFHCLSCFWVLCCFWFLKQFWLARIIACWPISCFDLDTQWADLNSSRQICLLLFALALFKLGWLRFFYEWFSSGPWPPPD